jgi:8-oxo-dGTP diphosphatase
MSVARFALRVFAVLPKPLRRTLVRFAKPSYTVGAMGVIVDGDQVLLARQSYRGGWAIPGGLLDRGETAEAALVREVWEEVGIALVIDGDARVVVDPRFRRVDVCFRGRLGPGTARADARPMSVEIVEAAWFPLDDLPDLQPEAASALQLVGFGDEVSQWLRRTRPEAPSERRDDEAW